MQLELDLDVMQPREFKVDEETERGLQLRESLDDKRRYARRMGQIDFLTPTHDKVSQIEQTFELFNSILKPTAATHTRGKTTQAMMETVGRKLRPWTDELNQCLYRARNYGDADTCADHFLHLLNTEGLSYVKKVAKDY